MILCQVMLSLFPSTSTSAVNVGPTLFLLPSMELKTLIIVDDSFKDSSISAFLSASQSSVILSFPSFCAFEFSDTIVATFLDPVSLELLL